jgi:hypothetical protein
LKKNVVPVAVDANASVVALLGELDNDDFAKRERAEGELLKRGQFAVPAIQKALRGELPSLEVRRRMARILEKLPVEQLERQRERERRALEVLERMATPEARQLVHELAQGAPGAALTAEAAATLERMDQRKKK